jgi:hypothetical protein
MSFSGVLTRSRACADAVKPDALPRQALFQSFPRQEHRSRLHPAIPNDLFISYLL